MINLYLIFIVNLPSQLGTQDDGKLHFLVKAWKSASASSRFPRDIFPTFVKAKDLQHHISDEEFKVTTLLADTCKYLTRVGPLSYSSQITAGHGPMQPGKLATQVKALADFTLSSLLTYCFLWFDDLISPFVCFLFLLILVI